MRKLGVFSLFCLLAGVCWGQLRIQPPSQRIETGEVKQFQINGAPAGANLAVTVRYPQSGAQGWLAATLNGTQIQASTTAAASSLRAGTYVAYIDAVVNQVFTARTVVILTRATDNQRYRFYNAGQLLANDQLDLQSTAPNTALTVDYNGLGGVESRNLRVAAEPAEPGIAWLNVTQAPGNTQTPSTLTVRADTTKLSSRSTPYLGSIVVYDPADPTIQSTLLVNLTVTGAPPGLNLTSGQPVPFVLTGTRVSNGENGYWIDVPAGTSRLRVTASSSTPAQLHVRRNVDIEDNNGLITADFSTPPSLNPVIDLTPGGTPSLQAGRYYLALQIISGTATGFIGAELSGSGGGGTPTNPTLAQVAAGGEWKTTIQLVNTTSSAVAFDLQFRDDSGLAWPVSLLRLGPTSADLGSVSRVTDTIPAGGMYTYQTLEQPQSQVRSGYAELVQGTGIRGQAIFQQANAGGFDYETAVPMTTGMPRFIIPFDNATSDATTSVALVNSGTTASTVSTRVLDETGQLLDARTLSLGGGQHRADTLSSLAGSIVSGRRGAVEFTSSGPSLSALGLRFRRAFTSLNSVPSGAQPAPPPGSPVMAQIAAGSDWMTTLILVNPTDAAQAFSLQIRDRQGNPLSLVWRRLGPQATSLGATAFINDTIPPGGTYTYQTAEPATAEVRSGYGVLSAGTRIQGQAIFQQRTASGQEYEAAVPMQPGLRRFVLPFDNVAAGGRTTTTSLAIVSENADSENRIIVRIRNDAGELLNTQILSMNAKQQLTGTLSQLFGGSVDNRRGTIEFQVEGPEVSAIGLRFRGAFTTVSILPM